VVPDVIGRIAPIARQIEGVLRVGVEAAGVVQVVAPGISKLAGKPVPVAAAYRDLQRVVAGGCGGVDLVDDPKVGILVEVPT
jgi:hypothetical protein